MLVLFSLIVSGQPCTVSPVPLNVSANTTNATCTAAGSATISVTNGTAPYTYIWTPNISSTNSATNLIPGNYTVEISDAGCHAAGPELVVNGDFSQGNVGFSSGYGYCSASQCLWPDGLYGVGSNPQFYHTQFWGNDHTTGTGNFMIINGNTAVGVTVWEETVLVTPNSNYIFSTWLSAMNTISAAQLQFTINGVPVGNFFSAPATTYNWVQFCASWNSGSNTTATIRIINQSTILYGNDFALDDISFRSCVPALVTFSISQNPTLAVNLNSLGSYCTSGSGAASVSILGGTSPYSYLWSNGQTTSSISGLSPGSYTIVVTDASGCSNAASVTINTTSNPPTAAIYTTPVCLGTSTQLMDASVSPMNDPITSWDWTMPGGSPAISSSQNPTAVYTAVGTHTVSLIVTTALGCMDTITQQVVVYNNPQALFSGGEEGCPPVCTQYFDASDAINGSITNWQWNFPGGSPNASTAQNPTVCYYTAGSYGATLVITNSYGCKDTTTITPLVNVYTGPNADFCLSQTTATADNPVFSLCDLWSQDVVQWIWDFGDGSPLDSTSTDPVHSYSSTVTGNGFYSYAISLYVQNQYGCWDTIVKTVEILPEFTFYIPNAFTPNGDQDNELFFGKSRGVKEYTIMVFDRWGNLIWDCTKSSNNYSWDTQGEDGLSSGCKWNGAVTHAGMDLNSRSGQQVQEDVYVWKVDLTDVFNKAHKYIGHVSVVK